jgi:hypothetical protein
VTMTINLETEAATREQINEALASLGIQTDQSVLSCPPLPIWAMRLSAALAASPDYR